MKTIGLIGGISWESTAVYYRLLNEMVRERLGGMHSAECLLYSFEFAEVERRQREGDWDTLTQQMIDVARRLEKGGAACLVICANTMHRMAEEVQAAVDIPLLHIVDVTAEAIKAQNLRNVGLLGTIYTMEQDFYKARLAARHGLNVCTPDAEERQIVNRIIYDELVQGVVKPESRRTYLDIISHLKNDGSEGVIFGCTEIELLLTPEDSPIPAFDTTYLHTKAAVDFALA
ncbi:MAG: aspartate/glutamate racemase family protein [bacterium]|nr:aspartate/glutamate racemase family protein [bacterium]